jgi:putative MATE family efflux protein
MALVCPIAMRVKNYLEHFKQALKEADREYTSGSIKKAIFYLSVPMVLEMLMESLFAVVDIFFVGKIGIHAVATVGLTESVLTILYSVGIGLSMAATAMVARRVGEKKFRLAGDAAFQVILIGVAISVIIAVLGFYFAKDMLILMGGEAEVINEGYKYTRIIFAGNVSIMLLFLINGIFRGAGNAAIAMRSLWLANGVNMILDPLLIFGLGPIPAMGLEGAAIATTIGRSIGVIYQLYHLIGGDRKLAIRKINLIVRWKTITRIFQLSMGGMGQFMIESASWIILMRVVSMSGSVALAGYTIAIRVMIFTLLPAFGMSNAAATLVGQNLGAFQPERAEKSVWLTARYAATFLGICGVIFVAGGGKFIGIFNADLEVIRIGGNALAIMCLGYVFFAYGMVMTQSFNGAGDTRTPLIINIFVLWIVQIPLAYLLSIHLDLGANGVFIAVAISHSLHAVVAVLIFRRGAWKKVKV